MRIYLRNSQQILITKDSYQKQERERLEAVYDREILAGQVVEMEGQLKEGEKKLEDLQEEYKQIEYGLRKEKEEKEKIEKKLKEVELQENTLENLVERANTIVDENRAI